MHGIVFQHLFQIATKTSAEILIDKENLVAQIKVKWQVKATHVAHSSRTILKSSFVKIRKRSCKTIKKVSLNKNIWKKRE